MSHRFVRCPHCKMPHDAAERVCPNTGLRLPDSPRPPVRSRALEALIEATSRPRSAMSELPPPEREPEPFAKPAKKDSTAPRGKRDEKDESRALIGEIVGGRYRVKGVLGEGGMGTVYDAEHIGLARQVAIKVLAPSQAKKRVAVKRFQQEARAAGGIGHPNICEVYDLGLLDDGSPYLVMEKLVGQTLAERISKEGGLPFEDVIEVLVQVLSGLVAAHDKGIVHRDIKPENIFLAQRIGSRPIIKLLDFGVSKMMPEFQTGDDGLDLTRTGMVMGTPYYMSPEQARGERNLDGRVDVYACGVVMYEALAGRRPFLAPNYNALLLAIINTSPRSIREIRPKTPPELEEIIRRAMAKNRDDRYPSAKHFLRDLSPPSSEVARVPAPPTLEERKRAAILGGGPRPPETSRGGRVAPAETARGTGASSTGAPPSTVGPTHAGGPSSRPVAVHEPASAALHSNMRARPDADRPTRLTRGSESTQFDYPRPGASASSLTAIDPPRPEDPDSALFRPSAESDPSIDIPIEVEIGDEEVESDSDDRTEIWHNDAEVAEFRAKLLGVPPRAPKAVAPAHGHVPAPVAPPHGHVPAAVAPAHGHVPAPVAPPHGHLPAPVVPPHGHVPAAASLTPALLPTPLVPLVPGAPPTGRADDEWDTETVVHRPDLVSRTDMLVQPPAPGRGPAAGRPPPASARPAARLPKPFNPDETMKLDTTDDIEIFDAPIDNQAATTPRRRR